MVATENDHGVTAVLQGTPSQLVSGRIGTSLPGSGNPDGCNPADWTVQFCLGQHLIMRKAYHVNVGKESEGRVEVIWPAWPATTTEEAAVAGMPLADLQEYWTKAGNRLRDSAKWMATVLGAAIATVTGTTPLTSLRNHHLQLTPAVIALIGLILLAITMLLVLQVMRPEAVSYEDVQEAGPLPGSVRVFPKWLRQHWPHSHVLEDSFYRWQQTVESNQDLYLPCGVRSLTALRQSMAIEEATLGKLARAAERAPDRAARKRLGRAQTARAARLLEFRVAAARIATIGEYYALRARSTQATYGGITCGFLGTAAIVLAFTWPIT